MPADHGSGRTLKRPHIDHEFPGYLGAMGRYLFRVVFLHRQYAAMMRATLEAVKTTGKQ
jgi:hypothetical protein